MFMWTNGLRQELVTPKFDDASVDGRNAAPVDR